jgi:hypothetical protein
VKTIAFDLAPDMDPSRVQEIVRAASNVSGVERIVAVAPAAHEPRLASMWAGYVDVDADIDKVERALTSIPGIATVSRPSRRGLLPPT